MSMSMSTTTTQLRQRTSISLPSTWIPPQQSYVPQAQEPLPQSITMQKTASRSRAREVLISCGAIMVDQACVALLCFKLHKLSITLPPSSSSFWLYLPSCLLSDLVVIAALQICKSYLYQSAPPEGYHDPNLPAIAKEQSHLGPFKSVAEWVMSLISLLTIYFATVAIGAYEAGGASKSLDTYTLMHTDALRNLQTSSSHGSPSSPSSPAERSDFSSTPRSSHGGASPFHLQSSLRHLS